MSEWFIHKREGNSFYFREKSMPDTDIEGFTITYINHGYTVLTGDMGCLVWQRYHNQDFDYGFPNKNTGIEYFAEKVTRAEGQRTLTWTHDKAVEDVKRYIEEFKEEDSDDECITKLEEMLECETWVDHPVIGQHQMFEDLSDVPDFDVCECGFGEDWDYHFKRKFEMVKSVSELILNEVNKSN
ncbi:MAG: hypothetical protein PHO87_06440 [Acholeplasmataceae bacterium]|nr:hypothetical protein [Acholeplasmataceae bacterium]